MILTKTVEPDGYPVTLEEAKAHLRVDASDEDTLITTYLAAATHYVEESLGQQLVLATYEYSFKQWPVSNVIELPKPPAKSVESIQYYDENDVLQTYDSDNYRFYETTDIGYVKVYGAVPSIADRDDAIVVTFTCGWGTIDEYSAVIDVPQSLRIYVLQLVGELYQKRELTIVGTIVANVPIAQQLLDVNRNMYMR